MSSTTILKGLLVPQASISDRFRYPIMIKVGISVSHVLLTAVLMAIRSHTRDLLAVMIGKKRLVEGDSTYATSAR